jgi:hypothetical protein
MEALGTERCGGCGCANSGGVCGRVWWYGGTAAASHGEGEDGTRVHGAEHHLREGARSMGVFSSGGVAKLMFVG